MSSVTAASRIDSFSVALGRATAWLTLAMVLMTFVIVVLRYAFDIGVIWLQESVTWMHASVFMLGAAYTLQREEHVRVDVFYRSMPARRQALVNAIGVVIFIFPVCGFLFFESWSYVSASWTDQEVSRDAGGLPYPFIPLLKSILLLMPLTVALQGVSLLLGSVRTFRNQ
ncbi:MAG: TRAP transporter small permease subunit [Gammaproteobacteria bacterium]|nr:TRAP transporter small permease subunit [Gammaproteobacteria bacterium]